MNWIRMPVAVLVLLGVVVLAVAQQQERDESGDAAEQRDRANDRQGEPGDAEAGDSASDQAEGQAESGGEPQGGSDQTEERPSAERVLQQLLRRRAENPLIEPARPNRDGDDRGEKQARERGDRPSPRAGTLRREGEFIIQRRGRMVRASEDPAVWMFVFHSDSSSGQSDPPMLLMPCQHLEEMEAIVRDRGAADSVEFVLSGQIFAYRGANYLLPTMVKRAPDRGNLNP